MLTRLLIVFLLPGIVLAQSGLDQKDQLVTEVLSLFNAQHFSPRVTEAKLEKVNLPFPEKPRLELGDQGRIISQDVTFTTLPFGDLSDDFGERAGYQLLWNLSFLQALNKIINFDFILSFGKQRVEASFSRIYPFQLDQENKQFFREKLSILAPDNLKSYALTSFRLIDDLDDPTWLYSPMVEKYRRLTGSSRSDNLFETLSALNDLMVFSGRPDQYNPKLTGKVEALVPIINSKINETTLQGTCFLIPYLLNLPKELVPRISDFEFIKRKLLRLELVPRDPYSATGSEVLYVDAETLLPVYRVIYNRETDKYKIIIGVLQLVKTDFVRGFSPVVFTYDLINNKEQVLVADHAKFCKEYIDAAQYRSFDPSMLGK